MRLMTSTIATTMAFLLNFNPTYEESMKRALFALVAAFSVSAPALANLDLAKAKNCMACHSVDKKLVGPSFKDIARKYASDKTAAGTLPGKVIKGGSGTWGPVPMPANPQVNDAEAKILVNWILATK